MKERIKLLADKAGQLQLATPDNSSADEIMVLIGPNIEKFAELIVREVLDQVDEFSRLTKAYQKQGIDPEIDVTKEVLKNFGFTRFPRS